VQQADAVPYISADKEAMCMRCQHCLAVCPTGAVSILGRQPADSRVLSPEGMPTLEQMTLLLRGRRSVRQYKDENVDPALLRQLLATLANAPTGANRRALTFSLIDDKAVMARFQQQVMAGLRAALDEGRVPAHAAYLHTALSWPYQYGVQLLFRNAPHALIISASPDALCPEQDIALALAYFELLASSAGLGTVWWGLLSMALETAPTLKAVLDLPADHRYYGMLFGIPTVHYPRAAQHDDDAVIKTVHI
jgi:nitroreductase